LSTNAQAQPTPPGSPDEATKLLYLPGTPKADSAVYCNHLGGSGTPPDAWLIQGTPDHSYVVLADVNDRSVPNFGQRLSFQADVQWVPSPGFKADDSLAFDFKKDKIPVSGEIAAHALGAPEQNALTFITSEGLTPKIKVLAYYQFAGKGKVALLESPTSTSVDPIEFTCPTATPDTATPQPIALR
jgi:hypothetical protein